MNREEKLDAMRIKLAAYCGTYPFWAEDEMEVRTECGNVYFCDKVESTSDGIQITILTEWSDDVTLNSDYFDEQSLKDLLDAIRPPMTLWVYANGKHIYNKNLDVRVFDEYDAKDILLDVFKLEWELTKDEDESWEWTYNGDTKLTACICRD